MAATNLNIPRGTEAFHTLPVDDDATDINITVEAGATLLYFVPLWQGQYTRRVTVRLTAPAAHATVYSLVLGNPDDRAELSVETIHEAHDTHGYTNVRAVLTGNAFFNFDGMIRIARGAHGSLDNLDENALLLSPDAHANAVPALEILADDVRASHASTVGQLDREQLFYLMSRGLPEDKATRMIVTGFVTAVLAPLPEDARARSEKALDHFFTST